MAKDLRIKLKIDADTGELIVTQKEFGKVSKAIEKSASEANKFINTIAGFAKVGTVIYGLKQGFDAFSNIFTSFVGTAAEFERFEKTLTTIEGSSTKAKESMNWIQEFAKNTPYELKDVTEAFVQMKAYGLNPVDGMLTTLGDTASAMNKPIMQAVEAMADALTGENERLKEFGIKASTQGDKIAYNWTDANGKAKNIVIKNNSEMIQSTLEAIFNSKYQGAMKQQMSSYDGMISNLSDSWTKFKKDFMDAGLFDFVKAFIKTLSETLSKGFSNALENGQTFTNGIIEGFNYIIDGLHSVFSVFQSFKIVFNVISLAFKTFISTIMKPLEKLNSFINGIIDSYNIAAQTLKLPKIDFKFYDFSKERIGINNSIKEDFKDIDEGFSGIFNTKKIDTFKSNLVSNFKVIQDEANKTIETTKGIVPGANDGSVQLGGGKSEGEKNADKQKKELEKAIKKEAKLEENTLNDFQEEYIRSQTTQTQFALVELNNRKEGYLKYTNDIKKVEEWFQSEKLKLMEGFNDDYNRSQMTQTQYAISELDKQYQEYEKYVEDKNKLDQWYSSELKQIYKNRNDDEKNWLDGVNEAFDDYIKNSSNTFRQVNNLFSTALYGMEDYLVDFITKGKASFSDFINSIAEDFVRMMVQMNITKPLAQAASSIDWGSSLGGLFSFANGGIMSSQGSLPLKAYSNGGIANSPQLALFGEGRMNEAYVPLPDGRTIPVTMNGNQGSTNFVLNIENNSGQTIDASQISQMTKTDSQGNKTEVISIIIDAYNRNTLQLRDLLKGSR